MSNFYTGKGDKGRSYVGKKSVLKTCVEIEALGQLDELNSMIGVVKTEKITGTLKVALHQIQENLFTVQSNVAGIMLDSSFKVPEFSSKKLKEMGGLINDIEKRLPPLNNFVISGTNRISAEIDLLRAKSRNVERSVLKIKKINKLNPDIRAYLNRLSSLFFALARWEARKHKEEKPTYR